MKNVTLKQLRYFEALASQCHFGRAAELCAVSQPALSVQIRELETSVGTMLFERSARNVRLTRFGEEFRERAQGILRSVDELGELSRVSGAGLSGALRLGIIPTIAPYQLPKLLPALAAAYPGLDVHVRETVTPRLLDELQEGRLDAAMVALPLSEPSLTETVLFEEAMLLVRPAADAGKPVPSAQDLRTMRVLLLEEGHCFRDQALSLCSLGPGRAREGLDGSSLSTLVQMVGAGFGVTLVPEMAVEVETRSADVAIDRFEGVEPTRTVGVVWRKTSPLAERLSEVADLFRETLRPSQSS